MGMNTYTSLKNQFLIAMPNLLDPHFARSVSYILEHNEEGAMGVIINHPLDINMSDLLEHLEIKTSDDFVGELPILSGGPVQIERGFILHTPKGNWESSMQLSEDIAVTTSKDILEAIANNEGPEHTSVILGYAGWGAGQLEQEIMENSWLNVPADSEIIFKTPAEKRWELATAKLGIDISQLSRDAGHA